MGMIAKIVCFSIGLIVSVQFVGALFITIDLLYNIRKYIFNVLQRIGIWLGVIIVIAWILKGEYRSAYLWGVLFFPVFHGLMFHFGLFLKSFRTR